MIADTTFLSDLHGEAEARRRGPAMDWLAEHRSIPVLATVISLGEIAVIFDDFNEARRFMANYRVLRLTPEIAYAAAAVDRELIASGQRIGENDTWIAGFCRALGQPIISRDAAFDRVRGLRRMVY
jgi:predicted nucleic acid-binding protein